MTTAQGRAEPATPWRELTTRVREGWLIGEYSSESGEAHGRVRGNLSVRAGGILEIPVRWEIAGEYIDDIVLAPGWGVRILDSEILIGSTARLWTLKPG